MNSNLNFGIDSDSLLQNDNSINNEFSEEENLLIFPERNILDYVKKKFDPNNNNIQVNLSKNIKMKMKIFFITYICNKVIDEIFENIKKIKDLNINLFVISIIMF